MKGAARVFPRREFNIGSDLIPLFRSETGGSHLAPLYDAGRGDGRRADRSGDVGVIAATARIVVLADWLFTAPAVVIQPLTGALLVDRVGYDFTEGWLLAAYGLYALVGACWLPVVGLQRRMRDLAAAAHESGTGLPPAYHQAVRWWFRLG